MYILATICFVLSFLTAFDFAPVLALIFFGIGASIMGGCLAKRFWTKTRVRLIELLFLMIVSSAIQGTIIQFLLAHEMREGGLTMLIVVQFCAVALWAMAGLSNAAIVAERLQIDGTYQRIGLITVYLLLPPAVVLAPILMLAICVQSYEFWPLKAIGCGTVAAATGCLIRYAARLRRMAKLAGQASAN